MYWFVCSAVLVGIFLCTGWCVLVYCLVCSHVLDGMFSCTGNDMGLCTDSWLSIACLSPRGFGGFPIVSVVVYLHGVRCRRSFDGLMLAILANQVLYILNIYQHSLVHMCDYKFSMLKKAGVSVSKTGISNQNRSQ